MLSWSALMTAVLLYLVKKTTGLRARDEEIEEGLDLSTHGERSFGI